MLERVFKEIENAPAELQDALFQSLTVPRYEDYYPGIFYDNVGFHTCRCKQIADTLPEGYYDKEKVILYLWGSRSTRTSNR